MTADVELLPLPSGNVAHLIAAQAAEIEALRELCGMAYQLAGVHDAPEKWLDALSNAAAGRPFSTDGLLPYWPQAVCEASARADKLRAEVDMLRGKVDEAVVELLCRKARAERLAEAMRRYGVHDQACVAANIPICTCGLDAALEQGAGRG